MISLLSSLVLLSSALVSTPQYPNSNQLPRPWGGNKWRHYGEGKFTGKGLPGAVGLVKLTGGAVKVQSIYQGRSNDRRYLLNGILDREFHVTAELRGKGKVRIEVESTASGRMTPKTMRKKVQVSPWFTAGEKWQTITFKGVENNPYCDGQFVTFRMESPGDVELRRPSFFYPDPAANAGKLKLSPAHTFVSLGEIALFKVLYEGKSPIMLRTYADASGNALTLNTQVRGKAFTLPASEKPGTRRINVSVPGEKLSRIGMVTAIPGDKFELLEQKAAHIKLPRKMNLLFLGDSLTDYYRGHNYIDMACFFIDRLNPGMITADNRGIGGDNCRYMIRRLTSVEKDEKSFPGSNNRARYFNMFNQKYDRIYIFIGANDSKVHSSTDWKVPYVTLPDQRKNIRAILKLLRRKFPRVPIVMIGAPNYHWELARKNALNRVKRYPKADVVMFCQVDDVKNFNRNAKAAAEEYNAKFIDTFSMTTVSKERKIMYEGDGVHLALPGEIFFAGVVLDDLASVFKK